MFVWRCTKNEWNAKIAISLIWTFYHWSPDFEDDDALYDLLSLRNDNGDGNEYFQSNWPISKPGQQLVQHTFFCTFFFPSLHDLNVSFFQVTIYSGRKDRMHDDRRVGIIAKKVWKKSEVFLIVTFSLKLPNEIELGLRSIWPTPERTYSFFTSLVVLARGMSNHLLIN